MVITMPTCYAEKQDTNEVMPSFTNQTRIHAFFYKEVVYKEVLLDWQKPKK